MTTLTEPIVTTALRRAAVRATRAPSVHNTQPWQLTVSPTSLELRADFDRRLRVLDPHGRQLLLSCGCALLNARAALAESNVVPAVQRLPDAGQPDLLARLDIRPTASEIVVPEPNLAYLASAIELRQTNRRRFENEAVPAHVLETLVQAALVEGAEILVITRPEDRLAVARLSQMADQIENADPAYRAELRAWTSNDASRLDGVPASAVPHVDGQAHDDVPIRDFDTHGTGSLPAATQSSLKQCFVLLGSLEDNQLAWLRTGEALERVLLEVTRLGYTASIFTQVIEVARTNVLLRQELGLRMHPHVLLRIGKAERTPMTRRRRLADVLIDNC